MFDRIAKKAYDLIGSHFGFKDGQFFRTYGGGENYSGESVTPVKSLQSIVILRCVTLLAGVGASLPIDVRKVQGDRRVRPTGDAADIERLLDSEPNPDMSSMDFRSFMWMSFLLWGNAYAVKAKSGNRVIALWPLSPDCVDIKVRGKELVYEYANPRTGEKKELKQDDILHIRWYSLDGLRGMSAIEQARNAIGTSFQFEKQAARFSLRGFQPSLQLKLPNKLEKDTISRIQEGFQKEYSGSEGIGKLPVIDGGGELSPISIPMRDAQFVEQRNFSDEQLAMLYGIQPAMLGIMTKSSSWGTSLEQQDLGLLKYTINPLLVFHEKAYERCLLPMESKDVYIKHNTGAFLRSDLKSRMESYSIAVEKGIYSRNEVRAFEDLDPYEGGDKFTVQSQLIDVRDIGKVNPSPIPSQRTEPNNEGVQD